MRNVKTFYMKNALLFQEGAWTLSSLTVVGGLIQALGRPNDQALKEKDAGGQFVLPGFIDLHCHGSYGIDGNQADRRDLAFLSRKLVRQGVTSFLLSLVPDSEEETLKSLDRLSQALEEERPGAECLGIHLEGPFLSPLFGASLDSRQLRPVDPDLLEHYQEAARGRIRMISLAPELPGALDLISLCQSLGIKVALGHSNASYEEAMEAYTRGAGSVTHLGNAMRALHHRQPGILGAALDSDLYAEIILDGIHLHPAFVRLVDRLKAPHRLLAVTDAMMAAGMADGDYHLGSREVRVEGGVPRLADGRLAGSGLGMGQALKNYLDYTGRGLEEAIPVFSTNPARFLGLEEKKGGLIPGNDADLVILDQEGRLQGVVCRGDVLY